MGAEAILTHALYLGSAVFDGESKSLKSSLCSFLLLLLAVFDIHIFFVHLVLKCPQTMFFPLLQNSG
jgi:hypothetical protein